MINVEGVLLRLNNPRFEMQFLSLSFLVRQSYVFLHLWHWSARLFGVLLSTFINGNIERHFSCCHFRFGLLSASNGGVIRNKCFNHDSVSEGDVIERKANEMWFTFSLKGNNRNNLDGLLDPLVRGVCIKALRNVSLDGPSADSHRLSCRSILRCLRAYYNLLKD